MASFAHLAKRFFASLRPGGVSAEVDRWAEGHLLPGEIALWRQMPSFDRRHAAGVAAEVERRLGEPSRAVLAAALLHDVGKIASGFGVFPRVLATLWTALRGRERVAEGDGRLARYVRHPAIGGDLLVEADADPLTVSWAREHHLPEREWSVPLEIGRALKAADDD